METINQIKSRWNSPTPPFFKRLRNLGLIVTGVGAAILSAPASLPVLLTQIAGYLVTAGAVMTSISQITVPHDEDQKVD